MSNLPDDFNWIIYLDINPDVKNNAQFCNEAGAIRHWNVYGQNENRKYKYNPNDIKIPKISEPIFDKVILSNPFVSVYTLTYNEEHLIEFFINHYRKMFPDCYIKIFDNYSTDNTVEIAKSLGCEIEYFQSAEGINALDDREFLKIKNNAWKNATTDWVIACDSDELLQITQDELIEEEKRGVTIIDTAGWHMINNVNNDINLSTMEMGWFDPIYSKKLLFNKKFISEINYDHGCHKYTPIGKIVFSSTKYGMLHYKFLSKEYSLKRRDLHNARWSKWNTETLWKGFKPELIYCPDEYWDEWYSKPLTNVRYLMK